MITVADFLGPDGLIAGCRASQGKTYEYRPQQIKAATLMFDAIARGRHVAVEMPTGSGKSLAYLAVAACHLASASKDSNSCKPHRVIVSTSQKQLQSQLIGKDLPEVVAAAKHAGHHITFAKLKGKTNYACKLYDAQLHAPQDPKTEPLPGLDILHEWLKDEDRAERFAELDLFGNELVPKSTIERIQVDDFCMKRDCPLFGSCFYYRARDAAWNADIVVVNHHLLGADRHLRAKTGNAVQLLPDASLVIIDEAHDFEDATTDILAETITIRMLDTLKAKYIEACGKHDVSLDLELFDDALGAMGELFTDIEKRYHLSEIEEVELQDECVAAKEVQARLRTICDVIARELNSFDKNTAATVVFQTLLDSIVRLQNTLSAATTPNDVLLRTAFRQKSGRIALKTRPIDVAPFLECALFAAQPVIATSATLATGTGSLDFWASRVGCPNPVTQIYDSPFDLQDQALIWTPNTPGLDPTQINDPEQRERYSENLCGWMRAFILECAHGGVLVLFTSTERMRKLYDSLRSDIEDEGRSVMLQGDAPKEELLDTFTKTGNAVLFATRSFFQGVDVQGSALSLVILERLPFDNPSDLMHKARQRQIKARGGKPFMEYSLPRMQIALQQAVGRLIRSQTDRGVIAILDSRLWNGKSYGPQTRSMLKCPITTNPHQTCAYFPASCIACRA